MNKIPRNTVLLTLFSLVILIVSCEEASEQDEVISTELSRITPANGSVDIDPDAEIQVEFTDGMDTASCQSRFGIYVGELSQIPTSMMGQMQGMLSGQFHWNEDQTMMSFHPDSGLMDTTTYSICIQEGMQTHHHGGNGMMGSGDMQGHGQAADNGIIVHFRTGTQQP